MRNSDQWRQWIHVAIDWDLWLGLVWKDICSVGEVCADMGDCIMQGFTLKVNSGSKIKFWKYKWLGNETLQASFPRVLNSVSTQKEA